MPQHLALKCAFIGYAFAGKKTQAELLASLYGLQTYKLSELVDEVLAFSESHPEPIPGPEQPAADQNEEAVSESSELED